LSDCRGLPGFFFGRDGTRGIGLNLNNSFTLFKELEVHCLLLCTKMFRPIATAIVAKRTAWNGLHLAVRMSTSSQQHLSVEEYLANVDYKTKGSVHILSDKTEVYASGNSNSKNGVLIIPDFFGWYTGRVRNVCDFFGDNSMYSCIPNFGSHGKVFLHLFPTLTSFRFLDCIILTLRI
jgi:hypothetical protein